MHILISNDDGVYAPGLSALYEVLSQIAEVTVVAPDRDRSAASKSLTLSTPIRTRVLDNGFVSVDGTPADCVHFALTVWMKKLPDLVVSGINAGANLGDDTLYSGTVAAATEGFFFGCPAIAVSLVSEGREQHYASAAKVVKQFVQNIQNNPLPRKSMINMNIPDQPFEKLRGIQVTSLGQRHCAEGMLQSTDPRGRPIYWIGPPGPEQMAGPGTDFHAIKENYVSVTPLQMDLTHYEGMPVIRQWLGEVCGESSLKEWAK